MVNPKTTIKDLLGQCLSKFHILDSDEVLPYFGLFESRNGGSIDGVLSMEANVGDVLQSWSDAGVDKTAKFLFMIRLQVPSLWGLTYKDTVAAQMHMDESSLLIKDYLKQAEVIDSNALHLQFIQAVYNIITGRYPVNADEALMLGTIHFILKFGVFKPETHKPSFLGNRIVEFIPIKLLKTTGFDEWEKKLLTSVEKLSQDARYEGGTETEDDSNPGVLFLFDAETDRLLSPEHKYMQIVYAMKGIVGSSFFRCTQKCTRNLPETVYLGVQSEGIDILDKQKKLLRFFSIEDIFRWGFKPNTMFYFEVNADNELATGSLEFETVEGKIVSDLMTDYAMAFLKERERAEERMTKALPPPPSAPKVAPPVAPNGKRGNKKGESAEFRAAVKIQALYRGYALRSEWIKEDASILIQSIYRGYKARCLLSSMIEQMIKDGEL